MLPVIEMSAAAKRAIKDSAPSLPGKAVNLVAGYAAEFDFEWLTLVELQFDGTGRVTNPALRALVKEAFMSSACSPKIKTEILRKEYAVLDPKWEEVDARRRAEYGVIFDEIATAGGRIILDYVELQYSQFVGMPWSYASLRFADLSDVMLVDVSLCKADLTGALVTGGVWSQVDLTNANLLGVDLRELHWHDRVFLTGATGMVADLDGLITVDETDVDKTDESGAMSIDLTSNPDTVDETDVDKTHESEAMSIDDTSNSEPVSMDSE